MFQKATFEEFLYFSLNSCVQDEILEKMHQPRSLGRYTPMFWGNAIEYKWCIHLNYWHLIDKGRGRPAGGEGKKCTTIPCCLLCPTSMYILKVLRVYPCKIAQLFSQFSKGNWEEIMKYFKYLSGGNCWALYCGSRFATSFQSILSPM